MLGVVTPVTAFYTLTVLGRLSRVNAAATAAHYGSVSAVTFLAAIEAADFRGVQTVELGLAGFGLGEQSLGQAEQAGKALLQGRRGSS